MNKENKALRVRGKREIDWMITLLPFSIIVVLCLLFFYAPIQSNKVLSQVRFILGDTFGTYYLIIGLGVFLLSIFVATSRYGNIVLGDPGEKPKYSFFAWGSMMFTAGLAADILFIHFQSGYYMRQTHILQNLVVFKIGRVYTRFFTGV